MYKVSFLFRDAVVPIILRDLTISTPQLKVMLNHRTCLIWHGNSEQKKRRFWQQLTQALQPPHNAIYNEDNKDFLMEVHKIGPIW